MPSSALPPVTQRPKNIVATVTITGAIRLTARSGGSMSLVPSLPPGSCLIDCSGRAPVLPASAFSSDRRMGPMFQPLTATMTTMTIARIA